MGLALGSRWGLGEGVGAGPSQRRDPGARAAALSLGPVGPLSLSCRADAEAACGEAAPGPHQPQPGRAEAAAAGADPGPGQSFRHPQTPQASALRVPGLPTGVGTRAALATLAPRHPDPSPNLGVPSPIPFLALRTRSSRPPLGSVSLTPGSVNFTPRVGPFSTSGVCKFSLLLPHTRSK